MLSLIIPTLNEEKYLPRLLESIVNQKDFSDYEIIVSDGNSTDKTREIAHKYGCRVVVSDRKSPAIQRNAGANIASGDILLFVDADNILPAGFLKKVYSEFIRKELDVAGFYLDFNSPRVIFYLFSFIYNVGCWIMQLFFPVSVGVGIMAKKDKHCLINGFDESIFIGEDYDYTKRMRAGGKYRMMSSSHIIYSVRRLEREGVMKVLWKWLRGSLYFLLKGPIRKEIVRYDFGNF